MARHNLTNILAAADSDENVPQVSAGAKHTYPRAESTILLILIGLFLWKSFLPAWQSLNTDFPNYYVAARLYRQGYPMDRVYDWTWIARQKDHLGIDRPIVGFSSLTLFSVLPVMPLATLPALKAKQIWLILNLILLGLVILLLSRMSQLGLRRVGILTFLALEPLGINFLYGQMHVLVLLLLVVAAWAYCKGQPLTSGLTLAVASAIKIYPALFVFYFICKKQWRAILGLAAGCIFLAGLSLLLFGWQANQAYAFEILPRSLSGACLDPYNVRWNSLTALLRRAFIAEPELNPHPIANSPAAFALSQALCQALIFVPFLWFIYSRPRDPRSEKLEWGGYVALLLILSTVPAPYHFCALIITGVLVSDYLALRGKHRALLIWVILYGLVCAPLYRWTPPFPSGWHIFLSTPRLYAELALCVFLLIEFNRASAEPLILRLCTRNTATFSLVFIFLLGTGAVSNFRSLRGQFTNYGGRVFTAQGSLMSTAPTEGRNGIWFVSMTPTGYRLSFLQNAKLHQLGLGGDAFHPVWSCAGHQVWVEISTLNSRIVRIGFEEGQALGSSPITEIQNATRPAISADGRMLAFIREDKGRGSL